MLQLINHIFVALLMLAAAAGVSLTLLILLVPALLENNELGGEERPDFVLGGGNFMIAADDSPSEVNFTIRTPRLGEGDLLNLEIYENGLQVASADCLNDDEQNYTGATDITCAAGLPYAYVDWSTYQVVAILTAGGKDYTSGPADVTVDWSAYEAGFWGMEGVLLLLVAAVYAIVVLPVLLFIFWTVSGMKHAGAEPGEYSLRSLIFLNGQTLLQKFHAFLTSPYFWAFEFIGVILIVCYLVLSQEIWKSGTAFVAFVISGLISFIVPFLWCCAWWYADYREREPMRIMVTFFLWGMLAALMAIGINTVFGVLFGLIGVGFLGSFFIAPPVEEFYKASGLGLLAEHKEYNSIEDGILFGFTIGMGFSFIENWIYLLDNPMGSDVGAWLAIFFMRCILFSANHGFFTAITGATIGWLIERRFAAPALGLLLGAPVAALFHAMHNSGEMLAALLGGGGLLIYCCLFMPFFDYGGLLLVAAFFIRSVLRQKGTARKTARAPAKKQGINSVRFNILR
ncbi:MAG: PrsW family intramembrane metalloprotease [Candidatus ainarchaeum sp.]|nr:PrsW family intramembrane metalloprotease [Candidatus ainarchaeum sp.]